MRMAGFIILQLYRKCNKDKLEAAFQALLFLLEYAQICNFFPKSANDVEICKILWHE